MNSEFTWPTVYSRIKPYQTRVLSLHSDNGLSDSPLVCSLHTADILHSKFEGLGFRSPTGEEDFIVKYEALSYTWGSAETTKKIKCNGVDFAITENLFQALHSLRPSRGKRYLWVDAISINQSDDDEKGDQVWNMLAIFENAAAVIAWLGDAQEDLNEVFITTNNSISFADSQPEREFDFWSIYRGISSLYKRPWFRRIWVQQEIFAARELRLQYGNLRIQWSQLLTEPDLLLDLPHLQPYNNPKKRSKAIIPAQIALQLDAVSELDELRMQNVRCFERFSAQNHRQVDFIETLLHTSRLEVTDPRDYIYGVIGMTGFPAKAMSIEEWTKARELDIFIPIDYTAHLTSILTAVTWATLMMGGLSILAKFKVFGAENDGTGDSPLPSWVIDWRLTARIFRQRSRLEIDVPVQAKNGWEVRVASSGEREGDPWRAPATKKQFFSDNNNNEVPFKKLILRGVIHTGFYTSNRTISAKKSLNLHDIPVAVWHLAFEVYPKDLLVEMLSFADVRYRNKHAFDNQRGGSGGLCLLRPVGNNDFKIIACLSAARGEMSRFYESWELDPEVPVNSYHRLAKEPKTRASNGEPWPALKDIQVRKFTII